MRSRFIIISFLFLLSLLSGSCKKYLDKKSDNTLTTFSTLKDLQALLDYPGMNQKSTPSYSEASSDDFFLPDVTFNARPENDRKIYTWQAFDYNFQNDWSLAYEPVYNANLCLELIENIPVSPQNRAAWNDVKGTALFYRAFYFLLLTWQHAKAYDENTYKEDLGIVLRLSSDFNIPSQRASVKASYEQVVKDAMSAADYLPDFPQHVLRPSKAAAYGLLARTFLSMRQYDKAGQYAGLCLKIKNDLLDYNNASEVNITNNVPFTLYNKETIFYADMNTTRSTHATARALIDTVLYAGYQTNDLRKTAFFRPSGSYQRYKGSYSGSGTVFFTGIATDEIYLISAECYARNGMLTEAMKDLNKLLETRYKKPDFIEFTATTPKEAVDLIVKERRKELLMRGLRWPDIKRLNKEGRQITLVRLVNGQRIVLPANDNYYALPLPADIINLSGIPQN